MATILILGDPTWPGPSWPWSCAGHPRTTRWGRMDIANVQERWLRSNAKFERQGRYIGCRFGSGNGARAPDA